MDYLWRVFWYLDLQKWKTKYRLFLWQPVLDSMFKLWNHRNILVMEIMSGDRCLLFTTRIRLLIEDWLYLCISRKEAQYRQVIWVFSYFCSHANCGEKHTLQQYWYLQHSAYFIVMITEPVTLYSTVRASSAFHRSHRERWTTN